MKLEDGFLHFAHQHALSYELYLLVFSRGKYFNISILSMLSSMQFIPMSACCRRNNTSHFDRYNCACHEHWCQPICAFSYAERRRSWHNFGWLIRSAKVTVVTFHYTRGITRNNGLCPKYSLLIGNAPDLFSSLTLMSL